MLFDASMTIQLLIKLSVRYIFFFIMTSSTAHGVVVVVIASFETNTAILFHPLQSLQDTYKRCINRTKSAFQGSQLGVGLNLSRLQLTKALIGDTNILIKVFSMEPHFAFKVLQQGF
jgi:hypothetical protein